MFSEMSFVQNLEEVHDKLARCLADKIASIATDAEDADSQSSILEELQNAYQNLSGDSQLNYSVLTVNTGGQTVNVKRSLLLNRVNDNNLFHVLSDKYDHLIPKDKEGRLFLDLDARWIEPYFNWLRDREMWCGEPDKLPKLSTQMCPTNRPYCSAVNSYFTTGGRVHDLPELGADVFRGSSLIVEGLALNVGNIFESMMGLEHRTISTADLLYRGSRDGFSCKEFMRCCSGKTRTFVLIKDTKGNVFGGFTGSDSDWRESRYVQAKQSFLFLLFDASDNETPTKYVAASHPFIYCAGLSEVGFGCKVSPRTHVLSISDNCNNNNDSQCRSTKLYVSEEGKCLYSVIKGKFQVAELEVFRVRLVFSEQRMTTQMLKKRKRDNSDQQSDDTTVNNETTEIENYADINTNINSALTTQKMILKNAKGELFGRICLLNEEVRFLAHFLGGVKSEDCGVIRNFREIANETRTLLSAIVSEGFSERALVNIAVGGRHVTVSKATLQQAPEGSPLANMASDAWGHDLDSDGNIHQDVNSELFVTIINHLRLKQLLGDTSIQVPPIVVYEEQKTALDNLLSFYMLTDLPVRVIA